MYYGTTYEYIDTDRQTALAFNTLIWGLLRCVPTNMYEIIGLINLYIYMYTQHEAHTAHGNKNWRHQGHNRATLLRNPSLKLEERVCSTSVIPSSAASLLLSGKFLRCTVNSFLMLAVASGGCSRSWRNLVCVCVCVCVCACACMHMCVCVCVCA